MKTDIAGIKHIAQRLTCVTSYEKVWTLCYQFYLLLKFAIQQKENSNKEKSFCQGKLPFLRHKLPFCWQKLRWKSLLPFFLQTKITTLPVQILVYKKHRFWAHLLPNTTTRKFHTIQPSFATLVSCGRQKVKWDKSENILILLNIPWNYFFFWIKDSKVNVKFII